MATAATRFSEYMYLADGARVRDYTINTAVQSLTCWQTGVPSPVFFCNICCSLKGMERKGSQADLWKGNTKVAVTETTFQSTDWTELAPNRF